MALRLKCYIVWSILIENIGIYMGVGSKEITVITDIIDIINKCLFLGNIVILQM